MDTITERLALFTLDNKQRTLTETADLRLGFGLCGAMLLDMLHEGALAYEDGGMLRPTPDCKLSRNYLQEAFLTFPSYASLPQEEVFKTLYQQMPKLKGLLLDTLEERGVLKGDEEKLKWSFMLKSYTVKSDFAGYRNKVLSGLFSMRISLMDFWVLQLVQSAELLWGSEHDKQQIDDVTQRLAKLSQLQSGIERLTMLVSSQLPATIAQSHKLTKLGKKQTYDVTWEWRGFWIDKGPTLVQASEMYRQRMEDFSFTEMVDEYLLVEGLPENLKIRKKALELKRPLESQEGYTAFSPKRTFPFPLSAADVKELFPKLNGAARAIDSTEALQRILSEKGIKSHIIQVKKKRFQVKLQSQVKVEFCTLNFNGRKYLSACVEGPDFDLTHAHSHNFVTEGVLVMGYVPFLKQCMQEENV